MISEEQKEKLMKIEKTLTETPFPPQIVIETTAFCNYKCMHCNHKTLKREKGSMDEGLYNKIVDEIAAIAPDTEVWPTFYGEAFILGEKLFDRLKYAKDAGLTNVVLNTNGSLLGHKDWIDKILHSGLKRFIISLDGHTKEVFEKVRYKGKFDEVYPNVEALLKRKQELGLDYPVIQCQFSIMEENRHQLPEFRKYWEERGAEVKSRNMMSWTNSGEVVAPNLDYESEFRIACPWANATMAIHYNGDVVCCAVDYEGNYVASNLKNDTIANTWTGKLRTEVREPHKNHDWKKMPELCQNCPDWQTAGATYYESESENKQSATSRPFWHEGAQ